MHLVDHVLIALLFLVQPVTGWLSYRRFIAHVEAGNPPRRVRLYLQTALLEWLFLGVLAAAWLMLDRPAALLGLVEPGGTGFWLGALVIVAVTAMLWRSLQRIHGMDAEARTRNRQALGDLRHFLPHTDPELRAFYGLSVTAGVVEEIVFRGFVLWYLSAFMPLWSAVVVSSAAFGLAHSYQGVGGMLRTGIAGLVFAVFYVLTGSIWLPVLGHVIVDVLQGRQIKALLNDPADAALAPERVPEP